MAKFINVENPSGAHFRIVDDPNQFRVLPRCRALVFVFTDIVDNLNLPLAVISMANSVFSVLLSDRLSVAEMLVHELPLQTTQNPLVRMQETAGHRRCDTTHASDR